jgi:hypothetical protein
LPGHQPAPRTVATDGGGGGGEGEEDGEGEEVEPGVASDSLPWLTAASVAAAVNVFCALPHDVTPCDAKAAEKQF